jgi:hypothetical protein
VKPIDVGDVSLRPVRVGRRWYIEYSCVSCYANKDLAAWHMFRAKRALGKDAIGHYFESPRKVINEFRAKRALVTGLHSETT